MTMEIEQTVLERFATSRSEAVDYAEYLYLLGDTDLTIDQQITLLRALGAIMNAFVESAFGGDPTSQALKSRDEKGAISRRAMVESSRQTPTEKFARAQRREE